MKKHVKIWLKDRGLTSGDIMPFCEAGDCGRLACDVHHIRPKGMGGSKNMDYIENLIGLCRFHHQLAHCDPSFNETLKEKALHKARK